MDRKLDQLLDGARKRRPTQEETEEQRYSFAFGNAPEEDHGTMDTIKAADTIIKTAAPEK